MKKIIHAAQALALGLAAALATPTPAVAQNDSASQLQLELDALDTVTDVLGPMAAGAQQRVKLMSSFVAENGMGNDYKAFASSSKAPTFHGMTFQNAYQQALSQEKSRGMPKPSSTDTDTLTREVAGQRMLAEGQWNTVNSLHDQVAKMTAFLKSKDKMDAYIDYAKAQANKPTPPDAGTDRRSESQGITPEQREANIAKYRAQQEALQRHWDNYHFTTGVGGLPPGGPFRGNPEGSPVGENPDQVGDYDPYIAAYPNSAVENAWYSGDYYGGSWWNGYADPYYDVYGYPGTYSAPHLHHAYQRARNAAPNIHRR